MRSSGESGGTGSSKGIGRSSPDASICATEVGLAQRRSSRGSWKNAGLSGISKGFGCLISKGFGCCSSGGRASDLSAAVGGSDDDSAIADSRCTRPGETGGLGTHSLRTAVSLVGGSLSGAALLPYCRPKPKRWAGCCAAAKLLRASRGPRECPGMQGRPYLAGQGNCQWGRV